MGKTTTAIKEFFLGKSGKNQESEVSELKLGEFGVKIISDEKLEHRIGLLTALEKDIEADIEDDNLATYIKNLKSRLDLINHAICEIATPYARAGTYPRFARMMSGWTQWNALANSAILHVQEIVLGDKDTLNHPDEERTTQLANHKMMVRFLHDFFVKHVFKDGFLVLHLSFLDADVSPRAAAYYRQ